MLCPHCGKDIPEENMQIHEVNCRRNNVKCEQCGEIVPKSSLEEHSVRHKAVRCPNCEEEFEQKFLPTHGCSNPNLTCRYCEAVMKSSLFKEHLDECGNRTQPCDNCGKYIMNKDLGSHLSNNCDVIKDENPDEYFEIEGSLYDSQGNLVQDQPQMNPPNPPFYNPPNLNPQNPNVYSSPLSFHNPLNLNPIPNGQNLPFTSSSSFYPIPSAQNLAPFVNSPNFNPIPNSPNFPLFNPPKADHSEIQEFEEPEPDYDNLKKYKDNGGAHLPGKISIFSGPRFSIMHRVRVKPVHRVLLSDSEYLQWMNSRFIN